MRPERFEDEAVKLSNQPLYLDKYCIFSESIEQFDCTIF